MLVVDVSNESVEVFILKEKLYELQGVFTKEDTLSVHSLKGLEIDLNQIFGV
jgi:Uma2 family endonuclease